MSALSFAARLPVRGSRFLFRHVSAWAYAFAISLPIFHFVKNTRHNQAPCTLSLWFFQKVLGFNRQAYWPVHFTSKIVQPKMIVLGVNANPGIEPGCYIQGLGGVTIGDNTQIAANVGIVSANHDPQNNELHVQAPVHIGSDCWIGMNTVVLPGVRLGDFTVVGAGSVVTRSFDEGFCVIAGNPARKLRDLDPARCIPGKTEGGYVGYLPAEEFARFRRTKLWL